jgi:DNA invertase Pin-like site-specific DNA recombinase
MNMLNNDGKLKKKFSNKKADAKNRNIDFNLSFNDYCNLMIKVNIKSSDVNPRGFHLSRIGDKGDYSIENCRFVWFKENQKEMISHNRDKFIKHGQKQGRISFLNKTGLFSKENQVKNKNRIPKNGFKSGKDNPFYISKEEINKRIELIKEVDFTKWGYVNKVAKILNMSHTNVRRFLNKHVKNAASIRKFKIV